MVKKAKSTAWPGSFVVFTTALRRILDNPLPPLLFVSAYSLASITSLIIQGKTRYGEIGYMPYSNLLILFFAPAITMYALALADNKKMAISDFMQIELKKFVTLTVVSVLTALVIILSILALVVPVIWIAPWFMLSIFPVADKGASIVGAFKESKRLSRKHVRMIWNFIGAFIAVSLLLAIMATTPYLGVVSVAFSAVWNTVALAQLYRWLQAQ